MSELIEKVKDAISHASVPHGVADHRSLGYYVSAGIDTFNHSHERNEELFNVATRAAIEAVFDWMAEPSRDVIDQGAGALELHDVRCAAPWDQLAGETFQPMLVQLRKEALG